MANEPYPIPQTDALQQVSKLSLQDLFSRDPEELGDGGLEAIVMHMQDLRERLVNTTNVKQVRVKKEGTAPGRARQTVPARIVNDPSELGF
jgi:hypothetical protein